MTHPNRQNRLRSAAAVMTLALMVGVGACSSQASTEGDAASTPPEQVAPQAVKVAPITERDIPASLQGSGAFTIRDEVVVAADLDGMRIGRVLVDEGQYVRAGQPLAQLDGALLTAQLASQRAGLNRTIAAMEAQQSGQSAQLERAQATLTGQRARAEQAQRELARVRGLASEGVVAEELVEQRALAARESEVAANAAAADVRLAQSGASTTKAAAADVAAARAQIAELELRRGRTVLRAPTDGLVLTRAAKSGDVVGPGSGALFRIARGGLIELSVEVAEREIARLTPGTPASVVLPSGETLEGKVRLASPLVDQQTRLGIVRIALPADQRLRPGGFGQARFTLPATRWPSVAESALIEDEKGSALMIVGRDNRAARLPVTVARRGGGLIGLEPRSGLLGAKVILSGAAFVAPGDRVNAQLEPAL